MHGSGTSTTGKTISRAADPLPMHEMNTTPLIDVMLVLLIMFIITVPMQSHEVELDLPGGPPPTVAIERLKNELHLTAAGELRWNGAPLTDRQLQAALGAIAREPMEPEVHFRPDALARYERVDEVLGMAARSGVTRFGFAGNEQYEGSF